MAAPNQIGQSELIKAASGIGSLESKLLPKAEPVWEEGRTMVDVRYSSGCKPQCQHCLQRLDLTAKKAAAAVDGRGEWNGPDQREGWQVGDAPTPEDPLIASAQGTGNLSIQGIAHSLSLTACLICIGVYLSGASYGHCERDQQAPFSTLPCPAFSLQRNCPISQFLQSCMPIT